KATIIPLVANLHNSHKIAGLGSCTCTNFCCYCHLTLNNKNNLKYLTWAPRIWNINHTHTEEWQDAPTLKAQNNVFDKAGVRWSKLFQLPYWNPMSYIVIDPIHCFKFGLLHHHLMEVWG
ncbi:hypothetical protein P691DRAFT_611308, partial [Macrolepiota fuliginosa MF-IS2]